MTNWHRIRFETTADDDPRPVKFPPPGPYWITGYGGSYEAGYATIVAYFPDRRESELRDYWPEAREDVDQHRDHIEFTSRFPKPSWWNQV